MKSFSQYLAEAGIRRKVRVARSYNLTPGETAVARSEMKREEAKRSGRVVRRAETEAAARTPFVLGPSTAQDQLDLKLTRAELAKGYGESMRYGGKPDWIWHEQIRTR
jgi:hypothetical protein